MDFKICVICGRKDNMKISKLTQKDNEAVTKIVREMIKTKKGREVFFHLSIKAAAGFLAINSGKRLDMEWYSKVKDGKRLEVKLIAEIKKIKGKTSYSPKNKK